MNTQLATKYTDNSILLLISASNEKKERQQAIGITGYSEQIARSYTDSVFRSHFRLRRTSAELLTGLVGACSEIPSEHTRGRQQVSVEKQ